MRRPPWLTRSNVLWGTGIALGLGMAIIALVAALATGKLKAGIGAGTTTVTSEKTDSQGKVIERTITTSTQDAKTLWDWLNLMGVLAVPITLAGLGALLQLKDQRRAKEQADLDRQQDLEIAQGTREEEDLQHYQARVFDLLIEKNLLAIAAKHAPTIEEKELLAGSVDILRGLTLSTLQQLSGGNRKASVVRLLIKLEIIQRLGVSLEGANLTFANLTFANLSGANLSGANLSYTNLGGAVLHGADLRGADLSGAKLESAILEGANLDGAVLNGAYLWAANLDGAVLRRAVIHGADLSNAVLSGADLGGAKLSSAKGLTKEQLEEAYLCETKLPEGIDMDSNRDCGTPYDEWFPEEMKGLIKEREAPPLEE